MVYEIPNVPHQALSEAEHLFATPLGSYTPNVSLLEEKHRA
jgi:hypothetical protein